jgi:uncharacterized protein YbjT (DUF2867 family)
MTTNDRPALVLGASGKSGRRVASRLWERNVPVRPGGRTGHPPFDWRDRATWTPALEGAGAAYLSFQPDLALPGAAAAVAELSALAADAGVERLVLLSRRGEEEARLAEQGFHAAAPFGTVLRCAWFAQNFSEGAFAAGVASGELVLPVGDAVAEPFVDVEDVADVAVAALTRDEHAGAVHELTGPRSLTFAAAVAELAAATGRDLTFVPTTLDEFTTALTGLGLPGDVVDLLRYLFTEVLDGRGSRTTDGVRAAIGRDATDFREYAVRDAAVWAPGAQLVPGAGPVRS